MPNRSAKQLVAEANAVVESLAAEDAVKRAKRMPSLGVGLHLAIFGARAGPALTTGTFYVLRWDRL